ncbi:MAG: glycosyltransferase family 2 protein [Anaerolineales bacterium]
MSRDQPTVSIITPSYNQAEFLEETIQSVLQQDYPFIEFIIVDGGSTDGSLDIIRSYESQLSSWVSEEDMGQTDAINKGFDMATGDILAWLNSDDTFLPGAVSSAVDFFDRNPWVGMVYANAYYIDGEGERIARYPAGPTDYKGLRRGVNTIPQQTMFFRSILWDMVGPLDPTFYYAMDYDLWVRIAAVTPIAFHPEYWAHFRLHSESKSRTAARRCWPEMMRVHFREGGSCFSILYAKYLIRRVVEPIMPLRIKARAWRYQREQSQ